MAKIAIIRVCRLPNIPRLLAEAVAQAELSGKQSLVVLPGHPLEPLTSALKA